MKHDTQTKEKLLAAAKEEFMEKGYQKASLRSICKRAGVTTGALYFFFQDKEDLFASLVKEPVDRLFLIMRKHYEEELQQVDRMTGITADHSDDFEVAMATVDYLYQYYEEFTLVITKSQGSKYEHVVDELIAVSEKHYRLLSDAMTAKCHGARIEDELIHWFCHVQIDAFTYVIRHGLTKEQAVTHMKHVIQFMIGGYMGLYVASK